MGKGTRMGWFNEARFGMFIHWGLYSIPARGEWVMFHERIPKAEYAKLAQKFNPKKFDAESWVKLAKESGMKYMVLTTRHHDGFCLFDSKASDFTSVKTAAKRDFVAEYAEACRKHEMKIGFYYSLLDWRFPGWHYGPEKDPESFNQMVEQAHSQVRELMTNYGKIDILWYDGGWIPTVEDKDIAKYWRSEELNSMVRELQPDIIINNRSGIAEDIDTPEQEVTAAQKGRCWESCMTIGDSWGYLKHNPDMKSTVQLIKYLVSAASGGGNYLLNIGPKPDGTIQKEFVARLKEIGKWMKVNGESIYSSERISAGFKATTTGGFPGTATAKGNIMYFHIFTWPGEIAVISSLKNNVKNARILATGEKLEFEKKDNGILILKGLPKNPPDKNDSVIAVELDGKPEAFSYDGIPL
ncbi:MAG: alpha-L-fucosidase [Actinomycetia bacterium]|nr:alpha-L-fucosidase [Actinomycetes bacterium]